MRLEERGGDRVHSRPGWRKASKYSPGRNSANVDISPQANNVVLQLRSAGGPQNLSARFTQYGDIVGSLFAPR